VRLLGTLARFLAAATRYSIALAAALMLAAILYQVFTRYMLGAASYWSEEFAVLMFSWSVLAGLALGVFVAWSGWRFLDITSGSVSAAMGYPIEILNALAPIAGALMAVFGLERALRPGGALPADEAEIS